MVLGTLQIAEICVIIVFLAFSAFFSGSETAYTGLSRARLKAMDPDGKIPKVQRAIANHDNFDGVLTTLLLGNNIVNTASSTVCTALMIDLFADNGTIIATILMITVLLIIGEITPKTLAKKNPEKVAVAVAGAVHGAVIILSPLAFVFLKITAGVSRLVSKDKEDQAPTDEETTAMIDELLDEGNMEDSENKLIRSAMEFDDKSVGDVCTPRVDIAFVDIGNTLGTVAQKFRFSGYTRLPVCEGTIDRITGYVTMRDMFLKENSPNMTLGVAGITRPVKFFPETTGLDDVFREMQKSQTQMSVIVDEYGGTRGIVTFEDLLEELVGEIYDESDEVKPLLKCESDGTYTTSGDSNIFDVMDAIGEKFECEDFGSVSIGGYVAYKLERLPRVGDQVRAGNAVITVKGFNKHRVREVSVKLEPVTVNHDEESESSGLFRHGE